ncbi:MAG TPA: hypothetical protein VGE41_02020 [Verrucomicrobiae bacterium]
MALNHIAMWDGTSWSPLGSGLGDNVNVILPYGGGIYAGGNFTNAGGIAVNHVARWDGTNWSGLGLGTDGNVAVLALVGNDLYAGGLFSHAGGIPANNIAKWNGSSWSSLGSGVNNQVSGITVAGNSLYVAGQFTNAGGASANYIASWDGTSWHSIGTGANGQINALAVSSADHSLYAVGNFLWAGRISATNIAKWDGKYWSPLGLGLNSANVGGADVSSLFASGSNIYAGGDFSSAGTTNARNIAEWDGSSWSPLGPGGNAPVSAIIEWSDELYASFGPTIARWNGTFWSSVGGYMYNDGIGPELIGAMAVFNNELFVGGAFIKAGGIAGLSATNIAKWDGTSWHAVGSGLDGQVLSLYVFDGFLYAGGLFTHAGSTEANHIAKWDGSSWSALSSGVNDIVFSLTSMDGMLYAGGRFTTAGGAQANLIARWNGTTWSSVGSATFTNTSQPYIRRLQFLGPDLYAGGFFATVNGKIANGIAKWNGTNWTEVSSGVGFSPHVSALTTLNNELYVGGTFEWAGGTHSLRVAKVKYEDAPFTFQSQNTGISNGLLNLLLSGPANASVVVEASTALTNWIPTATNVIPIGGWPISIPAQSNSQKFFRARVVP